MSRFTATSEDGARITSSLGVIADWMDALHGASDIRDVLENLVKLVKADAALLIRCSTSNRQIRLVEQFDVTNGQVMPQRSHSCLHEVVGENRFCSKPGSIWKLTEAREYNARSDTIELSGSKPEIAESLLITLASETSQADFLELQFRTQPLQHNLDLLTILAGALVTCWRRRSPGLAERRLIQSKLRAVDSSTGKSTVAILDVSNPAKLSRSEFRVCSMLQNGMTVKVIAASLSLSEATIRSHLSSIFAKTGTACQVELLGLLNVRKTTARRLSSSA